jgi:hypothetical protein
MTALLTKSFVNVNENLRQAERAPFSGPPLHFFKVLVHAIMMP